MSTQAAKLLRWFPALRRLPRPARQVGLRARIAILVSAGLLILFAFFAFFALSALGTTNDREVQQKSALAGLAASHLDSVLDQAAVLGEWSCGEIAAELRTPTTAGVNGALRDAFHRSGSVASSVLLFGPDGDLVRAEPSAPPVLVPTLPGDIQAAIVSGSPWAVHWVKGDAGGSADVVVPVRSADGHVVAFLGSLVDLSAPKLGERLGMPALGDTGLVDIVTSQGVVLSSTSREERLGPAGHGTIFADLTAQDKPFVGACYDCHSGSASTTRQREIMAFAPLRSVDWGVVLRQSEDEVLAPNRVLWERTLALGIGAFLIALLMVWVTTRGVLGPIRLLTGAARRISEGDLEVPVPGLGDDEIAELGHTFELMRTRLKTSLDEVTSINADLNRRVFERTDELEHSRDDLRKSHDEMRLLVERLSTLNAITTTLNGSLRLEEVLAGALSNVLRLTSMESGAIYLVDDRTGELEPAACTGIPAEATNNVVRLPFRASGKPLGVLCLWSRARRDFSKAEMDLLASVCNQIAVAVEKARLYEELQRKEQLRGDLLQKVISAQEEERKRIARELHDETSQALAALAVAVETAAGQCHEGIDVAESLARMKVLALGTLEEIHRLVYDLRPTLLDDLGLIAAMRWYAETRLGEVGISVRMEVAGEERRLGPLIETTLYRVVQEAVNNVANHSGARSFIATLVMKRDTLSLTLVDDGRGFDVAEQTPTADSKRGLGLMGMRERVELLGGTLKLLSEPEQGTQIFVEVPLEGGTGSER